MSGIKRISISLDDNLLSRLDALCKERQYETRSEAVRDMVRKELVQVEWGDPKAEVMATVTIVYEHHEHHVGDALTDLQHKNHRYVVSTTHVHVDAHNCLEVIILRGPSGIVRKIAHGLISAKGVKHGGAVSTTTGKGLR